MKTGKLMGNKWFLGLYAFVLYSIINSILSFIEVRSFGDYFFVLMLSFLIVGFSHSYETKKNISNETAWFTSIMFFLLTSLITIISIVFKVFSKAPGTEELLNSSFKDGGQFLALYIFSGILSIGLSFLSMKWGSKTALKNLEKLKYSKK